MKVLLDWVANHTARDARWVGEKPADWYERDAAGAPAVPWDWTDTAKLNYANRDVWRAEAERWSSGCGRHASTVSAATWPKWFLLNSGNGLFLSKRGLS